MSTQQACGLLITLTIGLLSVSGAAADFEPKVIAKLGGGKVYGEAFPVETDSVTLLEALDNPVTEERVISGTINQVCQKKGCWIILTEGLQHVRVKTKDHAFYLPKNSAGRTAKVVGVLKEVTLSIAQAEHFAEDARSASMTADGASSNSEKQLEQSEFQLSARSIWIAN